MKTVRCPQCNLVCWNTVLFCNRCGFDIQSIIEKESTADERSFEQNAYGHSAQNSSSFDEQNSRNFSANHYANPSDNQGVNEGYRQNYSRNTYDNGYGRNYQNPNQYGNNPNKTKKGMAIMSLVLGILGMPWFMMFIAGIIAVLLSLVLGNAGLVIGFSLTLLVPIIALILGIVSLKRANKKPLEYGGKGIAIGGICCSAVGLLIIPIFAAIAVPNLLAARRAANEGSAISSLRTLAGAEATFRKTKGIACADLTVLGSAQLIDSVLARGEKTGYRFIINKLPTLNGDCAITATPISESIGNRAFYYSTEDGEIRARKYNGQLADMNDEPIE